MSDRTVFLAGWCGICRRFLKGQITKLPTIILEGKITVKPSRKITIQCPRCRGLVNLVARKTPHDAFRAAQKAHEKNKIRKLVQQK